LKDGKVAFLIFKTGKDKERFDRVVSLLVKSITAQVEAEDAAAS